MPETDPNIIKLNKVRLSFPSIFAPKSFEGSEPAFSAAFLLDTEKHATLIKQIEKAIDRVALDHFKKKVSFKSCLHDGNDKAELEGYGDGVMYISARSKRRPAVVDRTLTPVDEADGVIYAGCYVNASIRLWVQDNKFGKRVNAELRGVQFVKDGESFGAGPINAEEEFDKVEEDEDEV